MRRIHCLSQIAREDAMMRSDSLNGATVVGKLELFEWPHEPVVYKFNPGALTGRLLHLPDLHMNGRDHCMSHHDFFNSMLLRLSNEKKHFFCAPMACFQNKVVVRNCLKHGAHLRQNLAVLLELHEWARLI